MDLLLELASNVEIRDVSVNGLEYLQMRRKGATHGSCLAVTCMGVFLKCPIELARSDIILVRY